MKVEGMGEKPNLAKAAEVISEYSADGVPHKGKVVAKEIAEALMKAEDGAGKLDVVFAVTRKQIAKTIGSYNADVVAIQLAAAVHLLHLGVVRQEGDPTADVSDLTGAVFGILDLVSQVRAAHEEGIAFSPGATK